MAKAGYVLAGFDQRGFGRSGGRRGHTPSLEAYFDDIDVFLQEAAHLFPGLPRFLYGMSMGGVLVLAYTPVRQPVVVGVIAAAPGLKLAREAEGESAPGKTARAGHSYAYAEERCRPAGDQP